MYLYIFFLWFHIQEIIAACSVVTPLSCVFFCGYPVFPGPCVEKTGFSSLNGFGTLVKNHLTIYVLVVICSPSGFSVHGIFQAGILEWVPISCSGRLPVPGIKPTSPESPAL